ncbi:MAG: MFS transporter [Mycobacteriaceae bacterium]|nr:MFS transporter [Mycobacteriaceae bacterium]
MRLEEADRSLGEARVSPAGAALTRGRLVAVLLGLMLGVFLAALDQMVVSVAIRTIGDDLHGLQQQAWVTTAYLIAATVSTPLYGKLSDIYGRKQLFVAAILMFLAGSAACAAAQSMSQLAALRAVQGLGAGGLMSLAVATIGDIAPPRKQAKYQSSFVAVFGTASVAGPLVGGFLAGRSEILGVAGWRWVFLVNVPIAAVALLVVGLVLNLPHTRREQRVDWWGAVGISVCVVPLLVVAEHGRDWGWRSDQALTCYATGLAGLVLFMVAASLLGDEALIPLRLFRSGVVAVAALASVLIGMAMFGGLSVIPLYLQIVKGRSPTEAGLMMLPVVTGIAVGSIVSGQLIGRTGRYKIYPLLGSAVMAAGMLVLATVNADSALSRTHVGMFVFGVGLGNCLQTLVLAMQNAVPARDLGVASAAGTFFRQIGATLGTAIFLSMLFDGVGTRLGGRVLMDSSFVQRLTPAQARPFHIGFADAMRPVFLAAAGVLGAAFVFLCFLREIPLRGRSGLEERYAEQERRTQAPRPAEPADPAELVDLDALGLFDDLDSAGSTGSGDAGDSAGAAPGRPGGAALPMRKPAVRGQIRRSGGGRVGEVALTLIDPAGRQAGRTVSLPDGRYELRAPGPGSYVLIASAHGHQPRAASVSLGTGMAIVDMALTGTGLLRGQVRSAVGGAPVAEAAVTLADAEGEVVSATVTANNGEYRLDSLIGGEYTVVVSADHFRPVAAAVAVPAGGQCAQDVELPGLARLLGVADTDEGRLVADARVSLLDSAGALIGVTHTDDDGEYMFSDLPEGQYTVVATGYPRVVSTLRVGGAETATHHLRFGYPEEER